tara:strand:+ start:2163 stop:3149 length:987 start_codon:yes stop_codon:yes gene_type:complete
MAKKYVKLLLAFAVAVLTGCSPDYSIVTGGSTEVVYQEVPVYVYEEVPTDPGEIWIDSFIQPQSVDGVDIIWVIDTSGSMSIYDEELLAGIEAMMLALPSSGWRLAMMSNDPVEASLEAQFPLVPGDTIQDAIDMYTLMGRGHREEGFDAAYEYLVNNTYAQTWLRPDAALLVVFVSDEEDQSDDYFPLVSQFTSWFGSQRNGSAYIASIVNVEQADSACERPPSVYNIGYRYMEATNYFGGTIVDICSDDWSPGVNDASSRLEPAESWPLTYEPVEDSIRVFINGSLNYDWTYSSTDNTIYFTVIPGGNDLVEIGYRYFPEDEDTGA